MWILLILLVCNCFIAGVIWESNLYEPLRLRVFLALIYLILGLPIHLIHLLIIVTRKPRQWIEARTQLWFWIRWSFDKNDYKGYNDDYYEEIARLYTANKGKFGPCHWSTRQAAKKILILNDRKLP